MKYNRIMLKISGEALAGEKKYGIETDALQRIAAEIGKVHDMGIDLAIVVGGGNFWRGRDCKINDRVTSDHIGMLGTTMNALALQDALEAAGYDTRVMSAIEMKAVCEPFVIRRALAHLSKKRIVIFSCGTGHPYFSTDSGAALRAVEIKADAIFMAKAIDAIYDSDPRTNANAIKLENPTYQDILSLGLTVMDSTAASLCKENHIPMVFFPVEDPANISKTIAGEREGIMLR